jgi:hypothetical protein
MFIIELPFALQTTIHALADTKYECAFLIGAISDRGNRRGGEIYSSPIYFGKHPKRKPP